MEYTQKHTQITGEEYDAIKAGRYMRYILLHHAAYMRMPAAYCRTNDQIQYIKPS